MSWKALKTITVINTYHSACLTAVPDHVLFSPFGSNAADVTAPALIWHPVMAWSTA